MLKCTECKTVMESKGELTEDGTLVFYQCPKCKNVEILERPVIENGLRMTYP